VALIVCVQAAKTDAPNDSARSRPGGDGLAGLRALAVGPLPKQERSGRRCSTAPNFSQLLDFGLSPFLYWWSQIPAQAIFTAVVGVMAVSGLLFLSNLNLMLHRLSAMLPDENLRQETKSFTTLNRILLLGIMLLGIAFLVLIRFPALVPLPVQFMALLDVGGLWLLLFFALPPLAMTMALLWKIKEVILDSVFGRGPLKMDAGGKTPSRIWPISQKACPPSPRFKKGWPAGRSFRIVSGMKSMTGYGRGECAQDGFKVTVELSSVNRKQSEISVLSP